MPCRRTLAGPMEDKARPCSCTCTCTLPLRPAAAGSPPPPLPHMETPRDCRRARRADVVRQPWMETTPVWGACAKPAPCPPARPAVLPATTTTTTPASGLSMPLFAPRGEPSSAASAGTAGALPPPGRRRTLGTILPRLRRPSAPSHVADGARGKGREWPAPLSSPSSASFRDTVRPDSPVAMQVSFPSALCPYPDLGILGGTSVYSPAAHGPMSPPSPSTALQGSISPPPLLDAVPCTTPSTPGSSSAPARTESETKASVFYHGIHSTRRHRSRTMTRTARSRSRSRSHSLVAAIRGHAFPHRRCDEPPLSPASKSSSGSLVSSPTSSNTTVGSTTMVTATTKPAQQGQGFRRTIQGKEECSLCGEPLTHRIVGERPPLVPTCGHAVHAQCISSWGDGGECAHCNAPLAGLSKQQRPEALLSRSHSTKTDHTVKMSRSASEVSIGGSASKVGSTIALLTQLGLDPTTGDSPVPTKEDELARTASSPTQLRLHTHSPAAPSPSVPSILKLPTLVPVPLSPSSTSLAPASALSLPPLTPLAPSPTTLAPPPTPPTAPSKMTASPTAPPSNPVAPTPVDQVAVKGARVLVLLPHEAKAMLARLVAQNGLSAQDAGAYGPPELAEWLTVQTHEGEERFLVVLLQRALLLFQDAQGLLRLRGRIFHHHQPECRLIPGGVQITLPGDQMGTCHLMFVSMEEAEMWFARLVYDRMRARAAPLPVKYPEPARPAMDLVLLLGLDTPQEEIVRLLRSLGPHDRTALVAFSPIAEGAGGVTPFTSLVSPWKGSNQNYLDRFLRHLGSGGCAQQAVEEAAEILRTRTPSTPEATGAVVPLIRLDEQLLRRCGLCPSVWEGRTVWTLS